MNTTQKKIIFETEDWRRFFVNAYKSSYPRSLIGIAKLRVHDVYSAHEQRTSEKLDSILFKLNSFPEISYDELVQKSEEEKVEYVYLHLRDVEGYTLSFCVYDVKKNEISCICDDEKEIVLIMEAYSEISKI